MSKSKIIIIIVMALVALLAVATIILSVVKIEYSPSLNKPTYIAVSTANGSGSFPQDNENFDKILTEYNNSYSRSILSAVFAGQTSNAINKTANGTLPTVNSFPTTTTYIKFKFNEPQELTIADKVLPSHYTEILVEVGNSASFVKTSVYYKQDTSTTAYYLLETYANQANLYEFINSLFEK